MSILKKIFKLIGYSSLDTMVGVTSEELFEPERKVSYFGRAGHKEVEGWLSSHTLSLVYFLDQFQQNNKIQGSVVEIGVFHGRFFIALCLLLRKGERGLAIDVFEDQEFNLDGAGVGDYGIFSANLQEKIGNLESIIIVKSDSLKMASNQLIGALEGKKARLFSIDGCHTAKHTENDLILAANSIVPGGVIILDDFENKAWPGVLEGTKQFLQKNGKVVPIAVAYNKLYLVSVDCRDSYQAYLSTIVSGQTENPEYVGVFGHNVLRALMPIPEALFPSEFQKIIDFSSFSQYPRKYLVSGWSFSEPWGVWSDGCTAKVEIDGPECGNNDFRMIIAFHAFVTEKTPEMIISIHVDMVPEDIVTFCFGQEYQTRTFTLSAEQLAKCKKIGISFVINEPKRPKDLGLSADQRRLGVGLRSIFFEAFR